MHCMTIHPVLSNKLTLKNVWVDQREECLIEEEKHHWNIMEKKKEEEKKWWMKVDDLFCRM